MKFPRIKTLIALLCMSWLLAVGAQAAEGLEYVEPGLKKQLTQGGPTDLLIHFHGLPDLSPAYEMGWTERGRWVHEQLTAAAESSQAAAKRLLDERGVRYDSLAVGNVMIVHQADMQTFNSLASVDNVKRIYQRPEFQPMPESSTASNQPLGGGPTANLDQIRATDTWNQLGFTGEDIVVGLNDSSPRYTHELLVGNYRGNEGGGSFDHNYNWWDPNTGAPQPGNEFHGTLVVSIMAGDSGASQTGVAPDADWIACGGCAGGSCAGVLQCLDWMVAPRDLNDENPDPDQRPHIVNNSWGNCATTHDSATYDPIWDSMYAAGVMPFFSNGNSSNCGYPSPPGLDTVGDPARSGRIMGIGSTTQTGGDYAPHSNWGPTDDPNPGLPTSFDDLGYPDLKPNVSAPGEGIPGAGWGSDTATTASTGTSFASPHASGAAAVMISAAPCLIGNHQAIGTILMETAVPVPYDGGGADDPDVEPGVNHPNYASGWGEIDVFAATQAAMAECGPTGTLAGTVTDMSSGAPIGDVEVTATDQAMPPNEFTATTGDNGEYEFGNLATGTYDLEFVGYGYAPATETGIVVNENQTTFQDAQLTAESTYTVSGTVTDSATGWPLHAEISVDGFPGGSVFTDPSDGSYSIDLPGGIEHDMTVTSLNGGYDAGVRTIGPLTGGQTEDFMLDADLASCDAPGYGASSAYSEDFEADDGGYTAAGSADDFAYGTPTGFPGGCASGTGCWGTNLAGDYSANSDSVLESGVIDLSGATGSLTLSWQQANYVETSEWDEATAEVSINGDPFEVMWSNPMSNDEVDWRELTYDVSAAAGGTIELRWTLTSDGSFQFPGVYVDDVAVTAAGACAPMLGELVTGRVIDANDGSGIDDATVEVVGGNSTTTATSADPAFGDGTYHLFVPEGMQDLEASKANFTTDSASGTFTDGQARVLDFSLDSGELSATPAAVNRSVTFGQTDTGPLILINEGSAQASFDLDVLAVSENFEDGFPPAGWEVVNEGGDCVWLTNQDYGRPNYAGGDGLSATADSDICGSGSTMDTSLVSPVFAPGGSGSLDFVLSFRALGSSLLDVDVTTDGGSTWTNLDTYDTDISPQGPGTPQSIDLSSYAGTPIQVRFRYVSPGWNWWAQVDQIQVTGGTDWLSVTPETGTFSEGNSGVVPQFESTAIDVNFDASAASVTQPGEYNAAILVGNDTPEGDFVVPVTMNVDPAANQARIAGTVSSTGYCDEDSILVEGAAVEIVGQNTTYNVTTDETGEFEQWMTVDEAPLVITGSAPDHENETLGGIPLNGTETTSRDMALRLIAPCPSADPTNVAATMGPDETTDVEVDVVNTGADSFDWNVDDTTPPVTASNGGSGSDAGLAPFNSAAVGMQSLSGGSIPAFDGVVPTGAMIDCDLAPELVISDDGSIENGYSGNPASVSEVEVTQEFTASGDGLLRSVCVSWLSLGPTEVDYEIVVYAADGMDAMPGTELGAVSGTATGLPNGLPASPAWYSLDLSSLGIELSEGESIYVGVRWAPSDPNVFAAADESEGTPLQSGFFRTDGGDWSTIESNFPEYRSLLVRPQIDVSGCAMPQSVSWISGISPASGTVSADSAETMTVTVDTTGLSGGTYTANLCVTTDDPQQPLIVVPVEVQVLGNVLFQDRFEAQP